MCQLKLTKLKLELRKYDFQRKKTDINTDKLATNRPNFVFDFSSCSLL